MYCKHCGKELPEGAAYCLHCGAAAEGAPTQQNRQANSFENAANAAVAAFTNTADTTSEFDASDISGNRGMAILSYFGLLVLIPVFAAKKSKFARFHANQGLVLFLLDLIYVLTTDLIKRIIRMVLPELLFTAVSGVFSLIGVLFFVLMIVGVVNAAQGKAKELPLIGKITILK